MQAFKVCERTPGKIHGVRVICRGRDSGCLETTHRLFDLTVRSGRQVTLQHCVKKKIKRFRSDIGFEWRRCPDVSSNLYPTMLLCPNRLLDPVETRRAAQCIDQKLLNRTATTLVEPCDVDLVDSQPCFASSTLGSMDELCDQLAKVDDSFEGTFAKRRVAARSPTTSLAPHRLPWTANNSRVSRCVRGNVGNSTTLSAQDVAKMVERCQESVVREDELLLGLGIAFVLAAILGILGVIFHTLASYRRARRRDDDNGGGAAVVGSGEDWQRHQASVQENNRDFFSNARIPEEEAGDWDDSAIPPHSSSTQCTSGSRWRSVFPWINRGTMSSDDSPRRRHHQQQQTGRYDGDDDAVAEQEPEQQQRQQRQCPLTEVPGSTTFVTPPASGHTVGKRLSGKTMLTRMKRANLNPKTTSNSYGDMDGNLEDAVVKMKMNRDGNGNENENENAAHQVVGTNASSPASSSSSSSSPYSSTGMRQTSHGSKERHRP